MEKHYYYTDRFIASVDDMIGRTFVKVTNLGDEIRFEEKDGSYFKMYHDQDCCEHVNVEDVVGDLQDLVGSPILKAEEVTGDTPSDYVFDYQPESYTWTFYKFATIKGYVDIRWLGTSNGYYSESVSIAYFSNKHED